MKSGRIRFDRPRCIVIAGPNGAGKTTFAREFLPKDAGVIRFVNADLIASGLSPFRPELATLAGGRLFLAELDRLARSRVDFAFETTLSGLVYLQRLKGWKAAGYRIEITAEGGWTQIRLRQGTPRAQNCFPLSASTASPLSTFNHQLWRTERGVEFFRSLSTWLIVHRPLPRFRMDYQSWRSGTKSFLTTDGQDGHG